MRTSDINQLSLRRGRAALRHCRHGPFSPEVVRARNLLSPAPAHCCKLPPPPQTKARFALSLEIKRCKLFATYHFTGSWPNTASVLSSYKTTFEVAFFLKPFEMLCKTNQDTFQKRLWVGYPVSSSGSCKLYQRLQKQSLIFKKPSQQQNRLLRISDDSIDFFSCFLCILFWDGIFFCSFLISLE